MDTSNSLFVNTLQQKISLQEQEIAVLREQVKSQQSEIFAEKQKCEALLQNMLPDEVYRELLKNGKVVPQYYSNVTVMFIDFVGFTAMCEKIELQSLIRDLDTHFSCFDDICEKHYLEKIKTIGDAYMCAGGMPMLNHSHPFDAVLSAFDILQYLNDRAKQESDFPWTVRIGIHTGAVIAGVVGKKKFLYDIWGDTVNVASRMETGCDVGKINISGTTYDYVKDFFQCTYRGKMPVKHKDDIDMYFVDRFLPQYSEDEEGKIPNKNFKLALSKL